MKQHRRLVAASLSMSLALTAVACSDDDDGDDGDTTTTTTESVETTVTTEAAAVETTTVMVAFDESVDEDVAEEAAATMQRRIETYFELTDGDATGTEVVVTDDGVGLEISVPEAADGEDATDIVEQLTFRGELYFRPGIVQYPAAPGEPIAPPVALEDVSTTTTTADDAAGDTTTTAEPTTTTTAAPPATIPEVTPGADVDPQGTSVLEWRDIRSAEELVDPSGASVLSLFDVGPAALEGTAVEGAELTTFAGEAAVKVVLSDDDAGLGSFNAMAAACFDQAESCASGAYTVTFDSTIVLASIVRPNATSFVPFGQDDLIVHSPDWDEAIAFTLAVAFDVGALPVGLSISS